MNTTISALFKFNPDLAAALAFADGAHSAAGQKRKYTGEPYIRHPIEVLMILERAAHVTNHMRQAALLHDVIEDTQVTKEDLAARFDQRVVALVLDLTDVAKPEDGNRATRVAINREHTAKANWKAKSIKLADLISNTKTIVERDPTFAAVYLPEKAALLEVLQDGDRTLYAIAKQQVREGIAKLKLETA